MRGIVMEEVLKHEDRRYSSAVVNDDGSVTLRSWPEMPPNTFEFGEDYPKHAWERGVTMGQTTLYFYYYTREFFYFDITAPKNSFWDLRGETLSLCRGETHAISDHQIMTGYHNLRRLLHYAIANKVEYNIQELLRSRKPEAYFLVQ